VQISSAEETFSPATVLVQLALQKWAECHVKADNISVVVVHFENCKSLRSSVFKCNYSFEEDKLAVGVHSVSSVRNPFAVRPCKRQICKNRHVKKSHVQKRKHLASIDNVWNDKCGLVPSRKRKFKIPTTPEQRSAYWSHRKFSKMIENLPLDLDLFVT